MTEKEAKEISMNFVEENKDRPIILHDAIKILVSSSEKKDRIIQQLKDENKTLNRQAQQYFETTIIQSQQYDKGIMKKDRVIDEMANYIKNPYEVITIGSRKPKTQIIKEYFERKVENETSI